MKVSVIIPIYNEERYISQCITSLVNQTRKPDEVIVVDDGSTDNSIRIVRNLQFTIYPGLAKRSGAGNFQLIRQKHSGPGRARNLGARHAKGDILVFVDGDMRFDKRYLEKLVAPIEKGKAVATFTKEEYVANPQNLWARCWNINSYLPKNLHIDPNIGDVANNFRAIRRDVFTKTQGYRDRGYGEDVTVLAQLKGVKAKVAKGAVCYHYNPSTLPEVFVSARWIGKGDTIKRNLTTILAYSFPNSVRRGLVDAVRHKIPAFLILKLIFDFGILVGLIQRMLGAGHAK